MTTLQGEKLLHSPVWLDKYILPGIAWAAGILAIFHLWQGAGGTMSATYLRPIHLMWVLVLIFLRFPLCADAHHRFYPVMRVVDVIFALLLLWAGWVTLAFDYDGMDHMLYGLTPIQQCAGLIILFGVLEGTRRTVGWEMAVIGVIFLLYALFGNYLPDVVANRGFSLERLLRFQVFTSEGIFGSPLGIAASTVFVFVLFGAFLEVTGAGQFFINLAYAAAGKYRGGPAKAAVVASAAMGSISGSAIANVVTTGAFTIPMMKKLGYKPEQAAGIEAAASTGGQIMPPIMGAGAFIMAEFTNTPYSTIAAISITPAILYFLGTLLYVHLMACRIGLSGIKHLPAVRDTLANGFHFIAPLVLITVLLLMNYSPGLVGVIGCGAITIAACLRRHTRLHASLVGEGLKRGTLMMLPISAACATAGIVVGVIGQTGFGLEFTQFIIALADGRLWLALLLVAAAALILGLGLPVTAAYIILAVMAAPALESMGVPLLVAHMVIFWLSQTSNVTPPVALAAFAAAGVAGARPMLASVEALKLAQGFFVIPLMMVYSDLLWMNNISFVQHILAGLMTCAVITALACAIENYAFCRLHLLERVALALAVLPMLYHDSLIGWVGVCLVVMAIGANYWRKEYTSVSGHL